MDSGQGPWSGSKTIGVVSNRSKELGINSRNRRLKGRNWKGVKKKSKDSERVDMRTRGISKWSDVANFGWITKAPREEKVNGSNVHHMRAHGCNNLKIAPCKTQYAHMRNSWRRWAVTQQKLTPTWQIGVKCTVCTEFTSFMYLELSVNDSKNRNAWNRTKPCLMDEGSLLP